MFENMKATRLAYEGGLISHEKAKAQLERDVRKTYYNMLLMQEQIELQRESLAAAERQVETARASYRAGLTPELTWLQAQVDRENKKPQIDQAEKGLKTSMAQFALNLGLSYDTQFELIPMEDPAGFVPLDVQELIAVASAGKPEIMELKNQILQLESSRKAQALSLFTPNLSVQWQTSFGMWDNVNNFHPFKETWEGNPGSLSITLSFSLNNLLPFGSGQQGLKDLEDSLKTARIGLAQAIQGAEIEIYSTILNLAQVQTSLDAQKGTVDLAERTYRLTETAYRNGLRTLVEVQNAELALRTAKSNIVNQQFTYLQGLIDLEYAIGVPFGTLSGRAQ
jgi:outer membrane protein TolC